VVWIQFAKSAVRGRVKTRLAATVGEQVALDAHLSLTSAVNKQLTNASNRLEGHHQLYFYVSCERSLDEGMKSFAAVTLEYDLAVKQQSTGDLGARMSDALFAALENADLAILVGSDFPVLDNLYLADVIDRLRRHDVVLGPVEDGGFGLIALRQCQFAGLEGIDWGTEKACAQTSQCLRVQGLSVSLLPSRYDVDELEDWQRWLKSTYYSALFNQTTEPSCA